jgi:N-acetylglucosaminyldiphosphoundecaprenol N-acetyl-beta-D-mannosaminyltransferase
MTVRVDVMGCLVDGLSLEQTLAAIDAIVDARTPVQHCVINANKIALMHKQPRLRAIVRSCGLVNADGQAVVWASRVLRRPLPERVAGIDLFQALLVRAERKAYSVYLLGATEEVLRLTVQRTQREHPALRIAGARNGFWGTNDDEVVTAIHVAGPDILFVGIPSPRKEYWLADNLERLAVPFCMGVGGSFDVYAGRVRRAPRWVQRAGLEWVYRFIQEPTRMWRRYLVGNAEFLLLLARYWAEQRTDAPQDEEVT